MRSRMSTASLRAAAHYGMTEGRQFHLKASCSNGERDLRSPAPEDLAALTVEAAAMAGVPLAGTNWVPGRGPGVIEEACTVHGRSSA